MSERSVRFIRRAARRILSDNREATQRKQLHGSLLTRETACRRAADIIALTMLNREGREWDSETNSLVFSLRSMATDVRTAAAMRIDCLEKLCVLDGLMPTSTLGDGAQDNWVRSLVEPKKEIVTAPVESEVEAALRKYREGRS